MQISGVLFHKGQMDAVPEIITEESGVFIKQEYDIKQEPAETQESPVDGDQLSDLQSLMNSLKSEVVHDEREDALTQLGVTVYDQSALESGLMEQLETALEAEEERKRKEQEEKERKKKLLKKARKKKAADSGEDTAEEQERQQEVEVANSADVLENVAEDEEKVKLGEMTPFGTTLESTTRYESSEASEQEELVNDSNGSDPEFLPDEEPKSRKKAKAQKRKRREDSDELGTDDSAWESSEDESGRQKKEKARKKNGKSIDDGDLSMYNSRIAEWKENKDDEAKGYEQFEGGFKMPTKIWKKLFRYQKVGVRWLWELYQQKCGGILGDEMGLGKTVQIIAFLAGIAYSNMFDRPLGIKGLGPVIIVAPTTLMHQWVREFHTWWPPLRVAILHESGSHNGGRQTLIRAIVNCKGVLVTSYTGIVQYKDELLKYNWHFVILDEGHKIRNPDSQATLVVKQFKTPYRLILSGSPIQNNLKELWSLFDFVFPGKLGTLPVFMQQFAVPITIGGYANASKVEVATAYKCACILRDTINPYLLRRQKADVKKHLSLPEKSEQVLFCKLTEEQRQLYKMYIEGREVASILEGKAQSFVGLINLRKICNHPDLFPLYNGQFRDMSWDSETRDCDWKRSGKMIVIESLLKIWKKQGHRVLLFSQSKQMLDVFERFIRSYEYRYIRLDGSTSIGARQPLIDKFNNDPSIFLFLLTTRVGGLGVNLTGANRVIIYDPDWNPMTDVQARERSWRIGQRKDVTIFRLLTSGTIEEKIYHRQIFKQFLTNKVLKDPKQRRFFKSNDLYDLFTLQEADKEGTETGAIFAGTGSEILRSRKKRRRKADGSEEASMSKKKKKAKIDGEEVENVEKRSTFKPAGEDEDQSRSDELQNEYVLQKLFKKSGLQSALKHDTIMESSAPDFELVEAEAEKVAKEAATWLKASRRECFSASAGIPTWTGSHGAKKPRFGTKQNTKLLGPQPTSSSIVVVKQEEKKKTEKQKNWDFNSVFGRENGSKASKKKKKKTEIKPTSSSANSVGKPLTSSEILARIRERNRLVGTADDHPEPEASRPRFRRADAEPEAEGPAEAVPTLEEGDTNLELLRQIRNFLLFGASAIGQASTDNLLAEFREKLPEGSAALFRALLREICSFSKQDGKGMWQLLPEFR